MSSPFQSRSASTSKVSLPTATGQGELELDGVVASLPASMAVSSVEQSRASSPTRQATGSAEVEELGRELPSLPPVDTGRGAWTFLLSSFVLEALFWGPPASFGVYLDVYKSTAPFSSSSNTSLSLIGTLGLLMGYTTGIPLLYFYSLYPHRIKATVWAGVGIYLVSMLAASFVSTVEGLVVLQGILPGLSSSLCVFQIYTWLGEWFRERRGIAAGIVIAGGGVGGAFMPFLTEFLIDRFGTRWTLRIWAIGTTIVGSVATYYCNPRIPVSWTAARQAPRVRFDLTPLIHPGFVATFFATLVQAVGYFNVGLYLPTFAASLGHAGSGAVLLSLFNIACIASQLIWGSATDRWSPTKMMALSCGLGGVTTLLLWGFSGAAGIRIMFAFVTIFGICSGGYSAMWARAGSSLVGQDKQHLATLFAGYALARGLGSVIGPTIGSELYHPTNSDLPRASWGPDGSKKLVLFVGFSLLGSAAINLVYDGGKALLARWKGRETGESRGREELIEMPSIVRVDL